MFKDKDILDIEFLDQDALKFKWERRLNSKRFYSDQIAWTYVEVLELDVINVYQLIACRIWESIQTHEGQFTVLISEVLKNDLLELVFEWIDYIGSLGLALLEIDILNEGIFKLNVSYSLET